MAEPVYLDHNATCPPRPEVLEVALPLITELWANPSSGHALGRKAAAAVDAARAATAAWAGVRPKDVIFTGSATEANHLALVGVQRGPGLLISAVEHPAVAAPALKQGAQVIPVLPSGALDLDALDALLASGPGLVSVMAANNETGVMFDLSVISQKVHAAGALLHVDAAQVGGRLPAPVGWDLLTLAGHKGGGLKGAGALILRPDIEVQPVLEGGGQERGRRAGTLNPAPIVALARSLELLWPDLSPLRDRLERGLVALGAQVTGAETARLPNTCHVRFPGVEGQTLASAMDLQGVCVSAGSACASGAALPSPVLLAMGLPAKEGVRFSLGWNTGETDVDRALAVMAQVLDAHRASMEFFS